MFFFFFSRYFFPNIITPEEKLGCSEKRWMMQYSANPIMYVLVKCVAGLSPLFPLNFCEAFITLQKQDWPRVAEKPRRLCGKEWRAIRSLFRPWMGWVCKPLNRYLHWTTTRRRQFLQGTARCPSTSGVACVSSEHPFLCFSLKRG